MSRSEIIPFADLVATMSPEARARVDARFRETMSRLRLSDIREAVGHTQVAVAAKLDLGQASVSKIESAADMYLSTLRRYIEALGGELVVSARFPEGTVVAIESLSSVPRRMKRTRTGAKKKAKPAVRKPASATKPRKR